MRFLILILIVSLSGCKRDNIVLVNPIVEAQESRHQFLIQKLEDSNAEDVMVVAHRAVWDDAPENSIKSIEDAIALGVDMVELDIRMTSDGVLILMHDETIDRMTDGSGDVAGMSLEEIRAYKLRNRNGGVITEFLVPTLEEAMLAAKDKILVRIDKAHSLGVLDKVYEVLEATETVDHACILVSQSFTSGNVVFEWKDIVDKVYFSPGVDADGAKGPGQVAGWLQYPKAVVIESSFADDENITIDWNNIREQGARIMVYTGSSGSSGGHDDDISLTNIDEGYGWLIERGVNMIQTDQPTYLLNYLRLRGLHD
ncbi:MAG: glycerophosphodiester phosphodiesterase family protein [Cyclobacteriaceae bacterium]